MGKARILVADDDRLSRQMMYDMLAPSGYDVQLAEDGAACLEAARREPPDLIFLDIVMPAMDGFAVCRELRSDSRTERIPVVLITSLDDRQSRINGLDVGANDFVLKPVDGTELAIRARNLLRVKEFEDFLQKHNEELDCQVRERTEQLLQSRDELKRSYLDTIVRLTTVAEYKDGFTAAHIKKVGRYCRLLAGKLGRPEEEQELILHASPMHDIGKVCIPSEILLKPGKLSPEEFALTKTHTTAGAEILKGSSSKYLQMAEEIALTHHERWDGSGYPRGLRADEIPIPGAIMNIADQYDALRSERPYKASFSHAETCRIISAGDGRTMPHHFNPAILEAFRDCAAEFEKIFEEHSS